jgi:hypothetical protein
MEGDKKGWGTKDVEDKRGWGTKEEGTMGAKDGWRKEGWGTKDRGTRGNGEQKTEREKRQWGIKYGGGTRRDGE